ncbi:SAM-dependent methyltransferase [Streptomyces mauvecolor]|uniref:SAM-dependent methyltransferase n=1 Tax=Streptomyces mauvecolor TaxID=58345 RepID=A0ABV9UZ76_9ACTN
MDVKMLATSARHRSRTTATHARALARIVGNRQIPLLLSLSKNLATPVYRAFFLTSAAGHGVLRTLAQGPAGADELAAGLGIPGGGDRLRSWLDIGVQLGDLGFGDGRYRLRSRVAKALSRPENDAVSAALEEVVRFHATVLLQAPAMLRDGRRLSLGDQDGGVIARSSRIVQPFIEEAIARTLDRTSPVRLLEIGCGSGVYVRYAASLNPRLSALAIDLQEEVAEEAAANMARWGLANRVRTRHGDLRALELQPQFDLVTMHNNIYYFPKAERTAALERARALLAPGGRLLLTTSCQGGNAGLRALNLWFENADFGGPLPHEHELVWQMERAGFTGVSATQIVPGEQFRAFVGTNAHAFRTAQA